MPTARLLALLLLIATQAVAQNRAPTGVPLAHDEVKPTDGLSSTSTASRSLPNAPTRQRVIDKKFIIVMGVLGGAESLRFTTRKLVLDHEFAAGAPWVTSIPANQHLVAKYAGIYAAELLVVYELKKPHSWLAGDQVIRRVWWAYPAAMAAIHIKNGVGNMSTQGPGSCTSVECAMQMQERCMTREALRPFVGTKWGIAAYIVLSGFYPGRSTTSRVRRGLLIAEEDSQWPS